MIEPIQAEFQIMKVEEDVWDIVILAEDYVLKAFSQVYDNLFYVEESIFARKPAVIVPNFSNPEHAAVWKEYWINAFSDPDNACKGCHTVDEMLRFIEQGRQKPNKE